MRIAAAIFAFNRPNYLKPVLKSIENNTHFNEVDFFIVQDSPYYILHKGKPPVLAQNQFEPWKETTKILKDFRFTHNNVKQLKINFNNKGIPRNKKYIHWLTKDKYDAVIFFEDDLIVSKHYIKLLLELYQQFPSYILSGSDLTTSEQFESAGLEEVAAFCCHWWGYMMDTSIIKKLDPYLDNYINTIGPCYPRRPHELIREKYGIHVTSHDGFIQSVVDKLGYKRLNFCIPRSRYIGAEGLHSRKIMYETSGFHNFKEFEFEEDAFNRKYTLRNTKE